MLVELEPVVAVVEPAPAPADEDERMFPWRSRHWQVTARVAGELAEPDPLSIQSKLTVAVRGTPSQVSLQATC